MGILYLPICAFLVYCINSGSSWPFGVILPELVKGLQCTTGEAAIAGAMQQGITLGSAVLVGGLVDLLDCHTVSIIGSGVAALGLMLNSFVNSVYQLYLTHGVITGFGLGLQFIPVPVAIHRQLPARRRNIVMGIVVSGAGIGTFTYAPLCRLLMNEYGWRGMYLILSALMLHGIPLSVAMRTPKDPNIATGDSGSNHHTEGEQPNSSVTPAIQTRFRTTCTAMKRHLSILFEFSLLQDPPFRYLLLSTYLLALGAGVPYVFLPSKAGVLGVTPLAASMLIAVIGLTDTVGRATFGALGTCFPSVFLLMLGNMSLGVLHIISYFCKTFSLLMVYATIFGFLFGNHATLLTTSGPEILGVEKAAKSIGISFTVFAMALCTAPSIGAYLWKVTNDPGAPFLFAGVTSLFSGITLLVCIIRYSDRIRVGRHKGVVKSAEDITVAI